MSFLHLIYFEDDDPTKEGLKARNNIAQGRAERRPGLRTI